MKEFDVDNDEAEGDALILSTASKALGAVAPPFLGHDVVFISLEEGGAGEGFTETGPTRGGAAAAAGDDDVTAPNV